MATFAVFANTFTDNSLCASVEVAMDYDEADARTAVKAAGYKWNSAMKHWTRAFRPSQLGDAMTALREMGIGVDRDMIIGTRFYDSEKVAADIIAVGDGPWPRYPEYRKAAAARR